jgi:LysR family transcriptional regulator, transcription activator of glutamate synthase operon
LELRQLKYLEAVARHGHFTRAADELHVAQSAVSHQIRRLEQELGVELLERTTRSVTLTAAGRVAVARARGALAEAEGLSIEIDELRGLVRGTIAIGALLPAGPIDLPALLAEFNRRYPGIEIEFREGTTADMTAHLERGDLDAAFVLESRPQPAGLGRLPLSEAEMVLTMSPAHPLAAKSPLPIARLDGQNLIAFRQGSSVRHAVDLALERAGARPRIALEGSDLLLIRALVAQGFGVAVLPRSFAELEGPPLSIRPLRPAIRLPVVLLWRREGAHSPAARAFLDFAASSVGASAKIER